MSWLDLIQYVTYALGAAVLGLWLFNLYRALKKENDNVPMRRLMYILAIIAVGLSIVRSSQVHNFTVVFVDVVVLLCILSSFANSEKKAGRPS